MEKLGGGFCSAWEVFSLSLRWDLFFPDIAPHCTLPVFLNNLIKFSHVFLQCCCFCFQCLSAEPLLSFFEQSCTALSFLIYLPFFFVYFSGLNVFSRFNLSWLFFSVAASHVVFLFHSSPFPVSIKNNLCCINIKFTIGFPFFLHNVRYSFCHIRKLNWMLQLKVFSYVFILHFKAVILFLIFHFHVGCVYWCLYALSVCKFHPIQKGGTWFLVMLSEEIQHFFTYLILREKRPSKKGLFNQKDFSLLSSEPWLYLFTVFLSAKSAYHWCHLGRKD